MSEATSDLVTLSKELSKATDEVKNIGEDLKKKYEAGAAVSQDAKSAADKALTEMNLIKTSIHDIEQKLVNRIECRDFKSRKSLGQRVLENDSVKSLLTSKSGRVRVEVKDITSVTTDTDGAAGVAVEPMRVPGIQIPPMQRLTVSDLLMPGTTASNAIQYIQETGFENKAEPVPEGALKPESSIKLASVTVSVQTIAHWVRATRQILDDAPQLGSYIDGRLRYGIKLVEEQQLLYGDGTGANLHGIVPQASAYSAPITVSNSTNIDVIRLAVLQAALAEYAANGIVLNHMDWAAIELTKDNEGRYIIGNPQQGTQPTLWGLPVVASTSMQAGKFLTGAFDMGAQKFDRQEVTVEISTEDRDNFVTNRVTILGEKRMALAVYRPESFIYGQFS